MTIEVDDSIASQCCRNIDLEVLSKSELTTIDQSLENSVKLWLAILISEVIVDAYINLSSSSQHITDNSSEVVTLNWDSSVERSLLDDTTIAVEYLHLEVDRILLCLGKDIVSKECDVRVTSLIVSILYSLSIVTLSVGVVCQRGLASLTIVVDNVLNRSVINLNLASYSVELVRVSS